MSIVLSKGLRNLPPPVCYTHLCVWCWLNVALGWEKIAEEMLEFAELALLRLNERKHWLVIDEREVVLRDALIAWKRSIPNLGDRYLPSISDVSDLQCAWDILDQDDNVPVTAASFATVIENMPDIAAGLQERISDCLAGKFLAHGTNGIPNLAKSVLICKNCHDVSQHYSYCSTQTRKASMGPFWPVEMYSHPCTRHNKHGSSPVIYEVDYPSLTFSHILPSPVMALANSANCNRTPWDDSCVLQDSSATRIVVDIISIAGQDANTTTVEEMDGLGVLFECEGCTRHYQASHGPRPGVRDHVGARFLLSWRRIVSLCFMPRVS